MVYSSILFNKFHLKYCCAGMQENNEKYFFNQIRLLKVRGIFFFNVVFEAIALFFIKVFLKRKRIAKYANIIPLLLTKRRRIGKTLGFLKKH